MVILYECGCCGCLHPWDWDGDCRADAYRYACIEDYVEQTGIPEFDARGYLQIEVRSMEDRLEADRS